MEKTILILDEDPETQGLLKGIFSEQGCYVTFAAPRQAELQKALGANPDLVFLELKAPLAGGLAILGALNMLVRPGSNEPYKVVLLASQADRDTVLKAKELRAHDFLIKPVDPEALVARAKKLLGEPDPV